MRIIDADTLLEKAIYMHGFGQNKYIPLKAVENAPTIDAEPVVRCKDCDHMPEKGWCSLHDTPMNRYDFCSCGERRADK